MLLLLLLPLVVHAALVVELRNVVTGLALQNGAGGALCRDGGIQWRREDDALQNIATGLFLGGGPAMQHKPDAWLLTTLESGHVAVQHRASGAWLAACGYRLCLQTNVTRAAPGMRLRATIRPRMRACVS